MFVFDVTDDDVARSFPSAEHCPIATAARRQGMPECAVGPKSIFATLPGTHGPVYKTTKGLQHIIKHYDETKEMKPFTVILIG